MEDEKKTSGKVHVFSTERRSRLAETEKEGIPRRRTAADGKREYQMEGITGKNMEVRQDTPAGSGQTYQTAKEQPARPVRSSRYTGKTWAVSEKNTTTKRRREQENELKMQSLKMVLGVLIVVLAAAIFYEIILGHGTKMTGSERMAEQQRQKQELMMQSEEAASEAESAVIETESTVEEAE